MQDGYNEDVRERRGETLAKAKESLRSSGQPSRLPRWLHVKTGKARLTRRMRELLRGCGVRTVCEAAHCPNIGECFSSGTATFMILGDICTRNCGFCAVRHGRPRPPDPEESGRVAEAAVRLGLDYVVVTCVTRDDLPDGGAEQFVRTVQAIKERVPGAQVEILTSDFAGAKEPLERVLAGEPTVFNHNVETVRRLQGQVRPQASYERSLGVLRGAAERAPQVVIKSGLMVGLGEARDEIDETLRDLAQVGCSIVTIGQYLRPSPAHLPVARYVPPAEFDEFREMGLACGLRQVISGPFVRSSYRAAEAARSASAPLGLGM